MTTKKKLEADAVAAYRAGAERRRAQRNLEKVIGVTAQSAVVGANYKVGVVTIKKPANAKPVSSLGGATKVFGRSSFAIPELGHYAKRSTR
jgi:hypothetical protein